MRLRGIGFSGGALTSVDAYARQDPIGFIEILETINPSK